MSNANSQGQLPHCKGMQTEEAQVQVALVGKGKERTDRQMDRRKDENSSKKTGKFCFVLHFLSQGLTM